MLWSKLSVWRLVIRWVNYRKKQMFIVIIFELFEGNSMEGKQKQKCGAIEHLFIKADYAWLPNITVRRSKETLLTYLSFSENCIYAY